MEIKKACLNDCALLAANLRAEDKKEIFAFLRMFGAGRTATAEIGGDNGLRHSGMTIKKSVTVFKEEIERCFTQSDEVYCAFYKGEIAAMFGLKGACAWCLTAETVKKCKKSFFVKSAEIVRNWLKRRKFFYCLAYADCGHNLKWLKILGAENILSLNLGGDVFNLFIFVR